MVTAIDRANRVVRATIDEIPEIECTYYSGRREPWPLCTAWFSTSNGSVWHCDGPIGSRRVLFHDDFTYVETLTTDGLSIPTIDCDSPWHLYGNSGGIQPSTGTGVGVAGIFTGTPSAGNTKYCGINKPDDGFLLPAPPAGLLLTARVTSGSFATNEVRVGFNSAESPAFDTNRHTISMDQAGTTTDRWVVVAVTPAGGEAEGVQGTTPVDGVWNVLELLLIAGVCTIGWVDGDGPYTITEPPPDPAVALTPLVRVLATDPYASTAQSMRLDYIRVESVTPVAANA